jgi:general secretion pathway protein G
MWPMLEVCMFIIIELICLGCFFMKKAFTLVEILIVVVILGILASVVLPGLQGQTSRANSVAVMNMLKTLRNQIEVYKFQHFEQTPGVVNGTAVSEEQLVLQFTKCTKTDGSVSPFIKQSGDYVCGPYVPTIAVNPYNSKNTIKIVADETEFSAVADGVSSGWLYKIGTGEIRINWPETHESGIKYYEL